ncbi:hypothetical protein Riv7116_1235 [Rivularia sp. PCC 7116]|uniref:hypothetical protein n=1 Tax=Rivularia sp. PCC 7116 TaxID=373994 RepID=UPI00029ECD3C|nr:hypothetical protein [Rivularia sp. PCC 7116]AFY53804.1 hypothetical protein Riv7116_1235 [Rivularia sp. PCC 7116]
MFLEELMPLFQEFTKHPASFMGGFVSGVLRLSLADDPVKSWLAQQTNTTNFPTSTNGTHNGSGPQTISID